MESSWTRDRICVSCIGRWISIYWATREILGWLFLRNRRPGKCFGYCPLDCLKEFKERTRDRDRTITRGSCKEYRAKHGQGNCGRSRDQHPVCVPLFLHEAASIYLPNIWGFFSSLWIVFLLFEVSNFYAQHSLVISWRWYLTWGPQLSWGFPGASEGKASACKAADLGSIPGLG